MLACELRGDPGDLIFKVGQQGRATFIPDRGVGFSRTLGARIENDAVENQPPDRSRYLYNSRVPQELLQIRLQRLGSRSLRRAEIGQQHANTRHGRMLIIGLAEVFHSGFLSAVCLICAAQHKITRAAIVPYTRIDSSLISAYNEGSPGVSPAHLQGNDRT